MATRSRVGATPPVIEPVSTPPIGAASCCITGEAVRIVGATAGIMWKADEAEKRPSIILMVWMIVEEIPEPESRPPKSSNQRLQVPAESRT